MSDWSGSGEFVSLLSALSKPSRVKIHNIAEFASAAADRHYKSVVYYVERELKHSKSTSHTIAIMYAIDAICRLSASKAQARHRTDQLTNRFASRIADALNAKTTDEPDNGRNREHNRQTDGALETTTTLQRSRH